MLLPIILVLDKLVGAIKFFLSVKLYSNFIVRHEVTTKLPIKQIPWFEKSEKYTPLFPILVCLLNPRYWDGMVDGTEGS